jgi:hypothetical protein
MRSWLLSMLLLLAGSVPARAYIGPPPAWQQLAAADCVVVGRLVAIEEKVETTHEYDAKQKTTWYVGLVKISDPLWSAQGLTHVRIGFLAMGNGERSLSCLKSGKDNCFILHRHPTEPFFITNGWVDGAVCDDRDGDDFRKWVAVLKRYGKLLEDPQAGLRAKDADDRLTTAALLLARYQQARHTGQKTQAEPIPAEESKLILETILKGDWNQQDGNWEKVTPFRLVCSLYLTEKDNFPPAAFKHQKGIISKEASQKWLEENMDVYRIQRYVPRK